MMKTNRCFEGKRMVAFAMTGLLATLVFAQAGFAQWNPYYVKQGDGAGGVVYRNAEIQVISKPPLSPLGTITTGIRPFGLVEILNNAGMPSGTIAMTGGMQTVLTNGEPVISFSSDGGNTWGAWQASGGGSSLTDLGGGNLSAWAGFANQRSYSADSGATWSAAADVQQVLGRDWVNEGNAGVIRDAMGNATKVMEIGFGSGESAGVGPYKSYYRESPTGGLLDWKGADGVALQTDPGSSWQYNSFDGNGDPMVRGTSEGSVIQAANGDLVAVLRTDIPAVYVDGIGGPVLVNDNLEGTAISRSTDGGLTWSNLNVLYEAGRMHGNLQRLPNGDLALTMINRADIRGTLDGTSADLTTNNRGADMLISTDNGVTWDLDKRITLYEVERLDSDPDQWFSGDVGHLATTVLGDGSLLTAFADNQADENRSASILVKWDPSDPTVLPTMNWGNNTSGDWNSKSNWTESIIPGDKVSTAVFGTVIGSAQTVLTNSAVTVRGVEFNNANTYAISGLGSIELDGDAGNATIDVMQGPHQFQVAVNLASDTDVIVAAGAVIAFNNVLDLNGNNLTKTGAGTMQINNELITDGGTVSALSGVVAGSGTILGSLTNAGGTVAPGNSPGTLSINGDYTQESGTLAIELAGLVQGNDYDLLDVSGIAALNGGTLDVTLLEGFEPSEGDVFDILDASVISGAGFDSISLPALDEGLAWDTSGLMSSGSLVVSASVVPEPTAMVSFLLGAFGISLGIRRKR